MLDERFILNFAAIVFICIGVAVVISIFCDIFKCNKTSNIENCIIINEKIYCERIDI